MRRSASRRYRCRFGSSRPVWSSLLWRSLPCGDRRVGPWRTGRSCCSATARSRASPSGGRERCPSSPPTRPPVTKSLCRSRCGVSARWPTKEVPVQRSNDREFASAQEMLPLEDVVDGVLCLRGGDYRAVLEAQSVNFALKSDTEQEAIMAGYRAFLNALSYPIQVVVRILPTDVEPYLTPLRAQANGRAAEALRRLALDHEAFVRRLARERTLLERSGRA